MVRTAFVLTTLRPTNRYSHSRQVSHIQQTEHLSHSGYLFQQKHTTKIIFLTINHSLLQLSEIVIVNPKTHVNMCSLAVLVSGYVSLICKNKFDILEQQSHLRIPGNSAYIFLNYENI